MVSFYTVSCCIQLLKELIFMESRIHIVHEENYGKTYIVNPNFVSCIICLQPSIYVAFFNNYFLTYKDTLCFSYDPMWLVATYQQVVISIYLLG